MKRFPRRGSISSDVLWWMGGTVVAGVLSIVQVRAFGDAGKGPANACAIGEVTTPGSRCAGLPPAEFGDTPIIREWVSTLGWTNGIMQLRRIRGDSDRRKPMRISAIADADRIALAGLQNRSIVVARISGDPETDEDVEYGIGGENTRGRNLQSDFYFVVQPFDAPTVVRKLKAISQVTIAKWTLYGLTRDKQALIPVDSGELKFCRHDHYPDDNSRAAASDFLRCRDAARFLKAEHALLHDDRLSDPTHSDLRAALTASSLSEIIRVVKPGTALPASTTAAVRAQRNSLNQLLGASETAALQRRLFEAAEFAPAWITCGLGCCSIDS